MQKMDTFNSNIGEKSSEFAFSVLKMRLFLVISKKKREVKV